MRKRFLTGVALVMAAALVLSGCGGGAPAAPRAEAPKAEAPKAEAPKAEAPKPAAPAKPIKVAMMAAITGPGAGQGKPLIAPVDLALADYNKTAKVPVELLFEDCGGDNPSALNGLNRLLESKPAALLNFCGSPQFNGMSGTLNKEALPTMLFGTAPAFYENGWKWLFGPLPIATVEASAGLKYLKEKLGKGKVALFTPNDDAGKAVQQFLQPVAKSLGIELVPALFQQGDNDFSGNIAAARRNNPDAYMFYGGIADTAKLLRQARQAGVRETIIGHIWAMKPFLNLMEPGELEGAFTWSSALPELSTDPKVQAFAKALKEKANQDVDWVATAAYDSATMVFNAVAQAGDDRAKVADALRAIQGYKGLSGEYSFDAKGRGRFETNIVKIGANKQLQIMETVKVKLD